MLTGTAKNVVQSLIGSFETGKGVPDYAPATVLHDGAGISYGRFQATDAGGNRGTLDIIVHRYIDLGGRLAAQLRPFLDRLAQDFSTRVDPNNLPQSVKDLLALLRQAGTDVMMKQAQDQVFDEMYWAPCAGQCEAMGLESPLSWAAVFDVCIQSGPGGVGYVRRAFPELPPARGGEEVPWVTAFVRERNHQIATFVSSKTDPGQKAEHEAEVRKTVYRTQALLQLVEMRNWDLNTPFVAHGVTIA